MCVSEPGHPGSFPSSYSVLGWPPWSLAPGGPSMRLPAASLDAPVRHPSLTPAPRSGGSFQLCSLTELHRRNSFAQLLQAHSFTGGPAWCWRTRRAVLGSFASCSWEVKPQFQVNSPVGSAGLLSFWSLNPCSRDLWARPRALPSISSPKHFFLDAVWEDGKHI